MLNPLLRAPLLLVPWLLPAPAATAAACAAPVVVRITQQSGELRDTSDWPRVALHADGCVALHRPAWYRERGDYVVRLGAAELAPLRDAAARLARVDWQAVNGERDARERSELERARRGEAPPRPFAEGVDLSRFELGGARAFAWRGVEQDAQRFADLADIARLRDMQRALVALLYDARAVREAAP